MDAAVCACLWKYISSFRNKLSYSFSQCKSSPSLGAVCLDQAPLWEADYRPMESLNWKRIVSRPGIKKKTAKIKKKKKKLSPGPTNPCWWNLVAAREELAPSCGGFTLCTCERAPSAAQRWHGDLNDQRSEMNGKICGKRKDGHIGGVILQTLNLTGRVTSQSHISPHQSHMRYRETAHLIRRQN